MGALLLVGSVSVSIAFGILLAKSCLALMLAVIPSIPVVATKADSA